MKKKAKIKARTCRDGGCVTDVSGEETDILTLWVALTNNLSDYTGLPIDAMARVAKQAKEGQGNGKH